MDKFIYSIEKQENEENIDLNIFSIDENFKQKLEKFNIDYSIIIKEKDFENLKINSDKIVLSKQIFKDKNDEKIVKIEIKNKELYQFILNKCKELEIKTYEEDLFIEHEPLIDKNIIIGNKQIKPRFISIDIETIGEVENQKIILISTHSSTNADYNRVYINKEEFDKKINDFKEFKPIICENEKELLEKAILDIKKFDIELILGWNVVDFDFKVIRDRCRALNIDFNFSKHKGDIKMTINNDFLRASTLQFPGLLVFDGIQLLKMNYIVYEDYKLNTVAKEVLKDEKIDLEDENNEISIKNKIMAIENMLKNNPNKLIEYNFKDSVLVSKIIEKLKIIEIMVSRSIITNTPLAKVKSPIATLDIMYLKELHKQNLVAPTNYNYTASSPIEGAYVLEPNQGFYEDVFVLDFKSLYPSIIMTFNIDPFTYNENGQIIAPNGAKFDKKQGILPDIIKKLYDERDLAKKNKDSVMSFALKITMNSFYGAIASPKSRFYNKEVGEAITAFGRFILQKAQNYATKHGYTGVYGDSVTKDSKILIKINNKIEEIEIQELFNLKGKEYEEKQPDGTIKYYKKLENVETLTMNNSYENIWKPIKFVMKHHTLKKLYKININNSQFVTVTSDHSLISFDFHKGLGHIKPKDATKVIYNHGFDFEEEVEDEPLAKFLGLWIGDGCIQTNLCNIRLSTGIDEEEIIEKVIKKINYFENSVIFKKGKGDIDISKKKIVDKMLEMGFVREWKSYTKRIPKSIFNQSYSFKCNFISGLFSSDGTIINRANRSIIRYTSINEDLIKDIQKLLYSIGLSSTYFKENKPNKYKNVISKTYSYHLILGAKAQKMFMKNIRFIQDRKNNKYLEIPKNQKIIGKSIVKKEILESDCDVYDISVEDYNRFYANNILVKNTDSIFISANKTFKSLKEKEEFGKELEKELNQYFNNWVKEEFDQKSFLNIEFEKLFSKFFIASKKRYVGFDEISKKIAFTGMEFVRGDWTNLAKKFQKELIERIFNNSTKDEIKKFILNYITKLENKEFDNELIYVKKITKPLSEYTKMTPPHVKAARELKEFDQRIVKYVMLKTGPKHISLIDENPDYDYKHYIEKQLKGVSDDILESFGLNFDEIFNSKSQKSLNRFF